MLTETESKFKNENAIPQEATETVPLEQTDQPLADLISAKEPILQEQRETEFLALGRNGKKRRAEKKSSPQNNAKENTNETDPEPEDERDEEDCSSEGTQLERAKINARRRALIKTMTFEAIVKDIRKQHPAVSEEEVKTLVFQAIRWAEKYQPGCKVSVKGIPKIIVDMQSLNDRYAQLEAPQQQSAIILRSDAMPIPLKDLAQRLSGEVVVASIGKDGEARYLPASTFWQGNVDKIVYKKVVFTNKNNNNDVLNLFSSFGVIPQKGKCNKILQHVKEVICSEKKESFDAFIRLLAWQVQNIGQPSRVFVVLKSKEHQTGKGMLLEKVLLPIYGPSGAMVHDTEKVVTRFNDILRGKAYIFLDECLFAGDRKTANAFKSLATANFQTIESKGVPSILLPIGINLFAATNHEDAIFVEEGDLRYWIHNVSPHRQSDRKYFQSLVNEIEGDGRSAFLDYLLNLDLDGFYPARDVPMDNDAKNEMIHNSINPYDARKWLEECCLDKAIKGLKPTQSEIDCGYPWRQWKKGDEYDNSVFPAAYTEWQRTIKSLAAPRPTAANRFGQLLNNVGFEQLRGTERRRILPAPDECLNKLNDLINKAKK